MLYKYKHIVYVCGWGGCLNRERLPTSHLLNVVCQSSLQTVDEAGRITKAVYLFIAIHKLVLRLSKLPTSTDKAKYDISRYVETLTT